MQGATRALVITEGLLIYLTPEDVAALATDLAAQPAAHRWLTDISVPILLQWMSGRWGKVVAEGGAPFRFAPEEGAAWFARFGWRQREFRGTMLEAARLKRQPAFSWLFRILGQFTPKAAREQWARVGFVLLERA